VAGPTGRIGSLVQDRLLARGHQVVPLSRTHGIDLLDGGPSLRTALRGVAAVIDASSLAATDNAEAERVHVAATAALLDAEDEAGVGHHVVLSIACLDRVSGGPHYVGKRAQERTVKAGTVPYTIVRATQFHDFPAMIARRALVDGVAPIPPLLLQPVAPVEVADVLVEIAEGQALGDTLVLAGPGTEDAVDMARRTLAAQGQQVTLRPTWQGTFGLEFAGEVLLADEGARLGRVTFDEWLGSLQ